MVRQTAGIIVHSLIGVLAAGVDVTKAPEAVAGEEVQSVPNTC